MTEEQTVEVQIPDFTPDKPIVHIPQKKISCKCIVLVKNPAFTKPCWFVSATRKEMKRHLLDEHHIKDQLKKYYVVVAEVS